MTEAERYARALAGYCELYRALARAAPAGSILEEDGLMAAYTGPLLPMNNAAVVTRAPLHAATMVSRALSTFARWGQRFAIVVPERVAPAVAAAAQSAGFSHLASEPFMLLDALPPPPHEVPGLTIQRVAAPETLQRYNDTMTAGFGGGPWALPGILRGEALLTIPDCIHYLGLLDGVPVATAMRLDGARVAGIANVSTLHAYRGRGIAARLTWQATADGFADGCVAAALTATEPGFPIYQRLGFRTADTFSLWLSPD